MRSNFFNPSPGLPDPNEGNEKIDRQSYLPAYVQLANILRQRISTGIYQAGTRLPSEVSLAKHFGLSAMTARQAVGVLVEEGLVKRIQGSGTFVQRIGVVTSNFGLGPLKDVLMDKEHLNVRILKATVELVTGATQQALQLVSDDHVVVVERLILHQQIPFTIQVGYARFDPESPIVENMLNTEMLTGLFSEDGPSCFMKGELRLLPTSFSSKEANLLEVSEGEYAFKLEHIFYNFSDQPASYGWFIFSPDKMPFVSKVGVWSE
ncbi:MAG: GntR family transcriptional regulator [Desulfobacteraceae bacterium]|jgi:GntR family transcriptional regulator